VQRGGEHGGVCARLGQKAHNESRFPARRQTKRRARVTSADAVVGRFLAAAQASCSCSCIILSGCIVWRLVTQQRWRLTSHKSHTEERRLLLSLRLLLLLLLLALLHHLMRIYTCSQLQVAVGPIGEL
jgi:hypothetical protein